MDQKQTTSQSSCVYCGNTENLTVDHVPPKGLFPKPRPSNLITVPCCDKCNGRASLDDEYFRLCVSGCQQTGDDTAAKAIRDSALRALERSDASGFRRAMMSQTKRVPFFTPSGLVAGKRWAFKVDLDRLFKVAERTVRGFFYAHQKRPLRGDYGVWIQSEDTLSQLPFDQREMIVRDLILPLADMPSVSIGDSVFSYRAQFAPDDPDVSGWIQNYYGGVHFLCATLPAPEGYRELYPQSGLGPSGGDA